MHDGELNRVLGGGLVSGSIVLLGGANPVLVRVRWHYRQYSMMRNVYSMSAVEESPPSKMQRAERISKDIAENIHYLVGNILRTYLLRYSWRTARACYDRLYPDYLNRRRWQSRSITRSASASLHAFAKTCGFHSLDITIKGKHCWTKDIRAYCWHRNSVWGRPPLYVSNPPKH